MHWNRKERAFTVDAYFSSGCSVIPAHLSESLNFDSFGSFYDHHSVLRSNMRLFLDFPIILWWEFVMMISIFSLQDGDCAGTLWTWLQFSKERVWVVPLEVIPEKQLLFLVTKPIFICVDPPTNKAFATELTPWKLHQRRLHSAKITVWCAIYLAWIIGP